MSWRLAKSLEGLRDQVNDHAPGRRKQTDGTIGNEEHQKGHSRHNPNDAGVVCALDLTDDPTNGCPIHEIADSVVANPHPALAYVISNRRVARRSTGWAWHTYTGASPHVSHAHFAVGVGTDPRPGEPTPKPPYDDTTKWHITGAPRPSGNPPPKLRRGSRGEQVRGLQRILIGAGELPAGSADGVFGAATEAAVRRFQRRLGVTSDGVVGEDTHAAIARLLRIL
ncbi:MAG TPA: peptidoglycan-binding domain-containing protein [Acidimicrobiales bacterium]|nr:peptidoglycan-binding domain-containing protein [Acidimicrobiales bacterium]